MSFSQATSNYAAKVVPEHQANVVTGTAMERKMRLGVGHELSSSLQLQRHGTHMHASNQMCQTQRPSSDMHSSSRRVALASENPLKRTCEAVAELR